jgi:hypothetical protein
MRCLWQREVMDTIAVTILREEVIAF